MTKSAMLRDYFGAKQLAKAVGAHDAMGAKLVEEAGFDAVWQSSFEVSASQGLPDASLVTMTEFLTAASTINRAIDIPVIADCDTGFGGPLNVAFAVQEYEARGIAAIAIEDKHFPKLNSFSDGSQALVSIDDFAAKLEAAKAAQHSADFVVIGRTETLIAGGSVTDALLRSHAYADAGADAILIHSKSTSPTEVLEFASAWASRLPLIVVPTTYSTVTEAELIAGGIDLVIYANQALRASVKAVRDVLKQLKAASCGYDVDHSLASMAQIFDLQGMPGKFVTS